MINFWSMVCWINGFYQTIKDINVFISTGNLTLWLHRTTRSLKFVILCTIVLSQYWTIHCIFAAKGHWDKHWKSFTCFLEDSVVVLRLILNTVLYFFMLKFVCPTVLLVLTLMMIYGNSVPKFTGANYSYQIEVVFKFSLLLEKWAE